ncbi:hypothetical protein [Polaribacter sp. Q13]|uniref:hypothetical protein n=1 Tax=Polaribacter sp. Q13 TaxID=2806551 RepID=UPI00193B05AF|nr:hypothetical protein [Polaribacter sp. Q13]QVY66863.1 hypothetical protein JOP69_06160 [Polaribacter sp. Q13]
MSFRKNLNFNTRLTLDIKTKDEKIVNKIRTFWFINNKTYDQKNNYSLNEQLSQLCTVKFNNGIYKESLVKIESRFELTRCLNLFKRKLETEFYIYEKSQEIKRRELLKDIHNLFNQRLEDDKSSKNELLKGSNNEEEIRKLFYKSDKREFNHLLAIANLKSKQEIVELFTSKGFDWKPIDRLIKSQLLWLKRDFDNNVLEYKMNLSLRNRLINYTVNEGIDIYNLEYV